MRKFTRLLITGLISIICFTSSVHGEPFVDPVGTILITNGEYCNGPWGNYRGGGGSGKAVAYGGLNYHTKTEVRSTLISGLDMAQLKDDTDGTVVSVNHGTCGVEVSVSDLQNTVNGTVYWKPPGSSATLSRSAHTTLVESP